LQIVHDVQKKKIKAKLKKRRKAENKCIVNDTKAAARQSLNCIKIKKIKYGEKRFLICRTEFLHPAMWHYYNIDFVR